MSYADDLFIRMCQDIIDNGLSTEGEKVRPVWEDTGESAYTIKRFGVVNRYDLSKEFPALTLRRTALKSAFDEILWIWQKKSNNIHDLNSHIWDSIRCIYFVSFSNDHGIMIDSMHAECYTHSVKKITVKITEYRPHRKA